MTDDSAKKDAALREAVNLLKVLDQLGGLGHDKHGWIKKTLAEIIPALQEAPASPAADELAARFSENFDLGDSPAQAYALGFKHGSAEPASPSPGLRETVNVETLIFNAYVRGADWLRENGAESWPYVTKAASDYADKTTSASRSVSEREG